MRNNLYMFRHKMKLTQQEIAEKIGCSRQTYSSIEKGTRDGRVQFWYKLQAVFALLDAEIGELMKKEVVEK